MMLDLSDDLKTTLIEEYSCERKPDDGEIYRKIREYQGYGGGGNPYFEKRWWALLYGISNHKFDNMKQIIRRDDFRAAFDIQLDVPGLGGGMHLGSTHKMFAMRCHEEMLHYLDDNIREFWTKIFHRDRQAMLKVNRADVKALELKAPGACTSDRVSLYGQLRSGKIFGAFTGQEREVIWTEILSASTDRLIPSLSSFFADVNYLQGPADCVKMLMEISPNETVSSTLEGIFSDVNQETDRCLIQQSESRFTSIPGSKTDRVELGCRQIWIGAMRNHLEMPPQREEENLLAKPRSEPNECILYEFASLAYRLGFESEQIHCLIQRSADEEIARKALLKARDPSRYIYNSAAFAHFVEQIVGFFRRAEEIGEEHIMEVNGLQKAPKRKGIPETGVYKIDQSSLFLDKLHSTSEEQCDTLTSFFIRRSVYFAFFGKPDRAEHERRERLTREEQERQDRVRLAEQERQERERLAREEQERLEQERLAREQERLEQERLAREEQGRLAREEQEKLTKEQQQRRTTKGEKASKSKRKPVERVGKRNKDLKRVTQINFDKVAESAAQGTVESHDLTAIPHVELQTGRVQDVTTLAPALNPDPTTRQKIEIHFVFKERGNTRSAGSLWVDPSDTGQLKRVAMKYMRKKINVCDKNGRLIKIQTCFEDAIADGENILYLIPIEEYGNAEYSSISGSVSDPQPNSTSQTNVASNAESDNDNDLGSGHKKKRATITSLIPAEDPLQSGLLKEELGTKKRIVIISGAGISTNAGIDDFRSSSGTKMSSKNIFRSSAYSNPEEAKQLHSIMLKIFESASDPKFTPFENLMENLAKSGRVQRHYTQNIDCRTARLPSLAKKTIWLHGRLDTMMCHINAQHTMKVTPESFPQWVLKPCLICEEINKERENNNKRLHSVGFLRPDILLYDERSPNESGIKDIFKDDLQQPIDAIIIVGTRLDIDSLRGFIEDLCHTAKSDNRKILTLWVNKERQKHGPKFGSLISYKYIGDCDEFASSVLGDDDDDEIT